MSDERRDDETGRALGRAVESQTLRETPYAASRLAQRVDRPAARGWTYALPMVAALALFLAMGAFFLSRGPSGVATPDVSASPLVTATSGPTSGPQTSSPTPAPTPNVGEPARAYFARDGLPPVGATVSAAGPLGTLSVAERISARVRALWGAPAPSSAGLFNVFLPRPGSTPLRSVTTTISNDTATVIIDTGAWDSLSSAETIALVGQLVYTITEEPGIRRAALREPGKDHMLIGTGILKEPLAREDVAGYSVPPEKSLTIDEDQQAATATTTISNEVVAPGLGRLAIELRPTTPVPGGFWSPRLKAELLPTIPPSETKWALAVTLPGVTDPRAGSLVGAGSLSQVDGSPIRALRVRQEADGVTYEIYLDDARPWRIGLERGANGAMIVLVDIGGHPSAITTGTAAYAPRVGATVGRSVTVSGLARAFEATVSWRVRDSAGREVAKGFTNASIGTNPYYGTFEFTAQIPASVSGSVTLEVYQSSPRDGSDTNKVTIPLTLR